MAKSILGPLLIVSLMSLPAPALADEPEPESQQLFVCEAEHQGMIELRAVAQDDGSWSDLQFYAFGDGLAPVRYSLGPGEGETGLFFSNFNIPQGYLVNVRFQIGQDRYRLYSLTLAPNESGISAAEGGLEVTGSDTKTRRIACDEAPYMFISYMRAAMRCDLDNPYGAAGCDPDNVPGAAPEK